MEETVPNPVRYQGDKVIYINGKFCGIHDDMKTCTDGLGGYLIHGVDNPSGEIVTNHRVGSEEVGGEYGYRLFAAEGSGKDLKCSFSSLNVVPHPLLKEEVHIKIMDPGDELGIELGSQEHPYLGIYFSPEDGIKFLKQVMATDLGALIKQLEKLL